MIERRRAPPVTLEVDLPKRSWHFQPQRHSRRQYFIFALCVTFCLTSSLFFRHDVGGEGTAFSAGVCSKYKGILMISQGDLQGAAGTIFFLFVLNQILYAEEWSLIPWIHLNNVSQYVYDPQVHGTSEAVSFPVRAVVNASWTSFVDPISKQKVAYAGAPLYSQPASTSKMTVTGNGVWNSYFHPVSPFTPKDPSCTQLPLVRLSHRQIIPALHVFCPWSLRAWRYGGLPPSLRADNVSYNKWLKPMRERGADLAERYVRFLPYLHRMAREANPIHRCLAVHIRQAI